MKPILFDHTHILSLAQTGVAYPVRGTGHDQVGLPKYLDSFGFRNGHFYFPRFATSNSTRPVSLAREDDQGPALQAVLDIARSAGVHAGESRNSIGSVRLVPEYFAQDVKAALRVDDIPSWYVLRPTTLEQGVIFLHRDGRIIHICGATNRNHDPYAVVGFGVMGAAMCYVQVDTKPGAGNEIALFGLEPVYRTSVTPESIRDLKLAMQGLVPTQNNNIITSNCDSRDETAPNGENAFDVKSEAKLTQSNYYWWTLGDTAAHTPIGWIHYQPNASHQNEGWYAYQLYNVHGWNDRAALTSRFKTISNPIIEAFALKSSR